MLVMMALHVVCSIRFAVLQDRQFKELSVFTAYLSVAAKPVKFNLS
jgi:hypothetical protein